MKKAETKTLALAMDVLALNMPDGVATAAIAEAANRLLALEADSKRLDWLETQVRILPAQRGAQETLHASVMVIGAKNVREAIDMAAMTNAPHKQRGENQ